MVVWVGGCLPDMQWLAMIGLCVVLVSVGVLENCGDLRNAWISV